MSTFMADLTTFVHNGSDKMAQEGHAASVTQEHVSLQEAVATKKKMGLKLASLDEEFVAKKAERLKEIAAQMCKANKELSDISRRSESKFAKAECTLRLVQDEVEKHANSYSKRLTRYHVERQDVKDALELSKVMQPQLEGFKARLATERRNVQKVNERLKRAIAEREAAEAMRAEAQAKYDKDRADYDACEAFFKKAEAQLRAREHAIKEEHKWFVSRLKATETTTAVNVYAEVAEEWGLKGTPLRVLQKAAKMEAAPGDGKDAAAGAAARPEQQEQEQRG